MATLRELLAVFQVKTEVDNKIDTWLNKTQNKIENLGQAIATTFAVDKVVDWTASIIEQTESVRLLADQFGMTTDSLQAYGYVAQTVGKTTEELADVFGKLAERSHEASLVKTSDAAKQFKELGIAIEDNNGALKGSEQLFLEVSDAVAGMSRERALGVLMNLFDDIGREFYPAMKLGSKGVKDMVKEFRELKGGFSESVIKKSKEASLEMLKFKVALQGVNSEISEEWLPLVTEFVSRGRAFLVWFTEGAKRSEIVKATLIALGAVAIATGIKMAFAFAPVLLAIAAVVAAILAIDEVLVAIKGGDTVLGALFGVEETQQFFSDLADGLDKAFGISNDKVWESFKQGWAEAFQWMYTQILEIGKAIKDNLVQGALSLVLGKDLGAKAADFLGKTVAPVVGEGAKAVGGFAAGAGSNLMARNVAGMEAVKGGVGAYFSGLGSAAQAVAQAPTPWMMASQFAQTAFPSAPTGGPKVQQNNNIQIKIEGNPTPEQQAQTRRMFEEMLETNNRNMLQELSPGSEP